jgi:hypothetical protein
MAGYIPVLLFWPYRFGFSLAQIATAYPVYRLPPGRAMAGRSAGWPRRPADCGNAVKAGSEKFGEFRIPADKIAVCGILHAYGISQGR